MSSLNLERLLFDPTAPSDGPKVGAYIIASDGSIITDTGGALDVNVANTSIAVTASDLDIRDLAAGTDNVAAWVCDGAGTAIGSTSSALDVYVTGSGALTVGGDVADDANDSGNPVLIGGHAYNQANALGALSAANDRGYALMDLYRRIFINDAPNRAVASAAVSVDDTAGGVAVPSSNLAGRTRVLIQNSGSDPIFVGPTGVTVASGIEVSKGGTLALEAGQAVALYAIAPSGKTVDTRVFELA